MILGTMRPICQCCCRPVRTVVTFMARTTRDGKIVTNRGSARFIKLCKGCVKKLLAEFRKTP